MTAARPSIVRHAAPADWTRAERGDLEKRLNALGTSITELSDARELLGFERLSDASREDRAEAVQNLDSPELRRALDQVRTCRAWLLEQLGALDEVAVRQARRDLGLRANRALRLGEMSALLGWALELVDGGAR